MIKKDIFGTLRALLHAAILLPIIMLVGCQNPEVGVRGGGYPKSGEIEITLDSKGSPTVIASGGYAFGARQIESMNKRTLNGRQVSSHKTFATLSREVRKAVPRLDFLRPRDSVHPLGTVYRKAVKGYTSEFDYHENLFRRFAKYHLDRAILGGRMLFQTMESLLPDMPGAAGKLRNYVSNKNLGSLSVRSMSVIVNDVIFTYLNRDRVLPINARIRDSKSFETGKSYFIADRIVRAKKISYIVPNNFLDKLRFDRNKLEEAAKNSPNVKKMDGYFVITKEWETRKIIAVGQSYIDVTKSGRHWIKFAIEPTPMEVFLAQTEPRYGDLLRR